MTYILLLRGINVGGKNKIAMPELKKALEKQDFQRVVTYINSGNILLDSALEELAVQAACEALIETEFHFSIAVGILTGNALLEALAHAPNWWDNDPKAKHNAIFVIPPITAEAACAQVGAAMPEYERVESFGRVIFWSAKIATISRTRWMKITQNKTVYNAVTIRNANTTKKLAELVRERNANEPEYL